MKVSYTFGVGAVFFPCLRGAAFWGTHLSRTWNLLLPGAYP